MHHSLTSFDIFGVFAPGYSELNWEEVVHKFRFRYKVWAYVRLSTIWTPPQNNKATIHYLSTAWISLCIEYFSLNQLLYGTHWECRCLKQNHVAKICCKFMLIIFLLNCFINVALRTIKIDFSLPQLFRLGLLGLWWLSSLLTGLRLYIETFCILLILIYYLWNRLGVRLFICFDTCLINTLKNFIWIR